MLFSIDTDKPSQMNAIVLENILHITSEDYGDQTTLTFHPAQNDSGKKILISGERGKVKAFFDTLALTQFRVVAIPKNLKMEFRDL